METTFAADFLINNGLSPWGVVLGFAGSSISLFVVNSTGLSIRKALLAMLSAMVVCAFVHSLASGYFEEPALASLATLGASILAPDAFTLMRANGKTITGRIGTMIWDSIRKGLTAFATSIENNNNNENGSN